MIFSFYGTTIQKLSVPLFLGYTPSVCPPVTAIHRKQTFRFLLREEKGELGTIELNKKLQAEINPPDKSKNEISVNGYLLRVGDKVMQIKK